MNYRYNEVFRKLEKPEGMGSEGVSCEVIGGEVIGTDHLTSDHLARLTHLLPN